MLADAGHPVAVDGAAERVQQVVVTDLLSAFVRLDRQRAPGRVVDAVKGGHERVAASVEGVQVAINVVEQLAG